MSEKKISKEMTIGEVVRRYPQVGDVFLKYGMSCFGCPATQFESVANGALVHGFDPEILERELNEALEAANA